jgi:hypothetical protein
MVAPADCQIRETIALHIHHKDLVIFGEIDRDSGFYELRVLAIAFAEPNAYASLVVENITTNATVHKVGSPISVKVRQTCWTKASGGRPGVFDVVIGDWVANGGERVSSAGHCSCR